MKQSFSKSKLIPLRKIFPNEATDFTVWLAKEENLKDLGKTLNMDLELEEREARVGLFSLDILCKNKNDKSLVAIENQFLITDHKHLGQIMTYGAGLKVSTMVWLAEDFTEEHLVALKWLNKHTDDKFRFFGVKVEARKIDDSNPAIEFNIVSKPADWRKPGTRGAQKTKKGVPTPLEIMQKNYWKKLVDYIKNSDSKLGLRKPYAQSGQVFTINNSDAYIGAIMDTKKKTIAVEFCMDKTHNSKMLFNILEEEKAQIEKEIGAKLVWRNKSKNISTKIILFKDADPKDKNDWADQHVWFKKTMEKFDSVFTPRVGIIDL